MHSLSVCAVSCFIMPSVRVFVCVCEKDCVTHSAAPACVLSRSRFLLLWRPESTMTSASANTPAISIAPHKDISGREVGGDHA